MNLQLLILPIHEPLHIFAILIAIILLAPFSFKIIKLPDVASFIIAGVIIGPYGFNILARDSSIELLGTIGLLYIMFVAGLELDPEKLKSSRKNSIVFGLFTFLFPFVLGMLVSKYLLKLDNPASILVSIMFSTHTLVAYPIVRKLGVHRDIAVLTAVGGTIITDTLVLMILSIITQTFSDRSLVFEVARLLVLFVIYLFIIFYTYPKVARWFFKNIKRDRPVHFLFLLLMVSISSILAELIGTEAIIGAFVAGLALNRSIPKNSLLMHHVDFVGSILFIPIFLVSIGMLINTRILISGSYLWYVSAVLILSALIAKWLAAFFSQRVLGFNFIQRNLLFGLTSSHAAATIAVILIGYERQMIDETIFNATVLIILASSLIASFITEKYGKKLAFTVGAKRDVNLYERILVPISDPSNMANLVEVANTFQNSQSTEPVYVLNIVNDDKRTRENLVNIREYLEKGVSEFNNLNEGIKVITRVDVNISSGILRAAKEYLISDIVFGWGEKLTTSQRLFGSIFDHLFKGVQNLYVCNFKQTLREIDRVVVLLPKGIEHEPSYSSIINRIVRLPFKQSSIIEFQANDELCLTSTRSVLPKRNVRKIMYVKSENDTPEIQMRELYIFFMFRKQSISFNAMHNNEAQRLLHLNSKNNFILIVPGFE
jgi:Kef-type K+ transport system membrane component KefB